jgi:glycosyltransferase involved in cell wall biosynthesis
MATDISVIFTFHAEKQLAVTTLRNIFDLLDRAKEASIEVELICVLDKADGETEDCVRRVTKNSPVRIFYSSHGDLGLSRNLGVLNSDGRFVSVHDGDDLYSTNYLLRHFDLAHRKRSKNFVLIPEFVLSFGEQSNFYQPISTNDKLFNVHDMLTRNPFVSSIFCEKSTLMRIPYVSTNVYGFAFEDWQNFCELIHNDYEVTPTPGTALFYRRRQSMLHNQILQKKLMPPATFLRCSFSDDLQFPCRSLAVYRSTLCTVLATAHSRLCISFSSSNKGFFVPGATWRRLSQSIRLAYGRSCFCAAR